MSKALKYILIGVLAVAVLIQFIGPDRPEVSDTNPDDLLATEAVDEEVATILRTACYDCHSMESRYPWYASVAPASWRVYGHIDHGREELNLSQWATLKRTKKVKALRDIAEVVEESSMPLNDYMLLHGDARLTDEQRSSVAEWAEALSRQVFEKK